MLVKGDLEAFSAGIAYTPRVILVRPDLDDPVVFNLDLQAATGKTQAATGLFPGHKILH
jgi:hypothetical protein